MDRGEVNMITVFTTGGTFDKVYFDANSQFHIGESQVEPMLKESNVTFDYTVASLLRKDSLEITDEDRQILCEHVKASSAQHIIITHGTDTMSHTAKALAAHGIEGKTIVLVGAMQPARMRVTDAPFNLGFACAAVQLLPSDIYIAMCGQVFQHNNVKKNLEAGRFETET
jgi:L-asparaginase